MSSCEDNFRGEYYNSIENKEDNYIWDIVKNGSPSVVISRSKLEGTSPIRGHKSKCLFIEHIEENTFPIHIEIQEYMEGESGKDGELAYNRLINTVDDFNCQFVELDHPHYGKYITHHSCYDISNYEINSVDNLLTSTFFVYIVKFFR